MTSDQDKPENTLYYIENGLIVFTEAYHLKRGYCCKSGCRHCPYDRKARGKLDQETNRSDVDNDEPIKK